MAGYGRLYPLAKALVTPSTRFLFPTRVTGLDNVCRTGPAIIAPNHISFFDSVALIGVLPRRITYVGKAEYLDSWKTRYVLPAMGMIPIERTVGTTNGRWFLARLRPYRTLEDKIEGVVATFVDVTERRQAESAWEDRQKMLLHELSHRVKNTLAVVQAITRQTLRNSVSGEVLDVLEMRLEALGRTHDLLLRDEWRGASLEALAREQLAPYLVKGHERVQLSGPAVILAPGFRIEAFAVSSRTETEAKARISAGTTSESEYVSVRGSG